MYTTAPRKRSRQFVSCKVSNQSVYVTNDGINESPQPAFAGIPQRIIGEVTWTARQQTCRKYACEWRQGQPEEVVVVYWRHSLDYWTLPFRFIGSRHSVARHEEHLNHLGQLKSTSTYVLDLPVRQVIYQLHHHLKGSEFPPISFLSRYFDVWEHTRIHVILVTFIVLIILR